MSCDNPKLKASMLIMTLTGFTILGIITYSCFTMVMKSEQNLASRIRQADSLRIENSSDPLRTSE